MQKKIIVSSCKIDSVGSVRDMSPLKMAILLVYEISHTLRIKPQVYSLQDERTLWVLFPEGCIECDELIEEYGMIMALISKHYPLTLYGMIDELEEGEVEVRMEHGEVLCKKRSFTGKGFNMLTSVYMTLKFNSLIELSFMDEGLRQIDFNKKCIALCSKWRVAPFAAKIFIPNLLTYYAYIETGEIDNLESNLLEALTVKQIMGLWTVFLTEGTTTGEFEYLYDQLSQGRALKMAYWELALRLTLSQLNIKIDYTDNTFKIENQEGKCMRLDFASSSAAEKLFLKILFPSS